MTEEKKAVIAKPVPAAKPPKKLVPRKPAGVRKPAAAAAAVEPAATAPIETAAAAAPEVPAPATAAAAAKVRPARKPSAVDETVARHQKVLAEALEMAQAIKYEQPKVKKPDAPKGGKAAREAKPAKVRKPRLVRDSYAMPEAEYARIGELKKRLAGLGRETKKSELLRGGIALLAALNDTELTAVMERVERIKTGRPAK